MKVTINGDERDVPPAATLAELLERLGKNPRFLAVERNEALVRRRDHGGCVLADGDRIEIVTLVGGG